MKRFCLLALVVFLTSCSGIGMQTRRDMVGNTFYASNPDMAIKLADGFDFVGDDQSRGYAAFRNRPGGATLRTERFQFINQAQGRAFNIYIKKISRGYALPNRSRAMSNALKTGKSVENGKKYYYVIYARKSGKGKIYLIKRIARTSGATGRILVVCSYSQALTPQVDDDSDWSDPNRLTFDQRNALSLFEDNYEKDIQFVQPQAPEDKPS